MLVNIHICARNYKSLQQFLVFILNKSLRKKLNITMFNFVYNKQKKNKIFTVLKSPHVNKTAQEHFEQSLYSKKLRIYSYKPFLLLVFLKMLKQNSFADLTFQIEIVNQPLKFKQTVRNKINPDNFVMIQNSKSLNCYIQILENYGNLLLSSKRFR